MCSGVCAAMAWVVRPRIAGGLNGASSWSLRTNARFSPALCHLITRFVLRSSPEDPAAPSCPCPTWQRKTSFMPKWLRAGSGRVAQGPWSTDPAWTCCSAWASPGPGREYTGLTKTLNLTHDPLFIMPLQFASSWFTGFDQLFQGFQVCYDVTISPFALYYDVIYSFNLLTS